MDTNVVARLHLPWLLLIFCSCFMHGLYGSGAGDLHMETGPFQGVETIRLVKCSVTDSRITAMSIQDQSRNNSLLVALNIGRNKNECRTNKTFAACAFDEESSLAVLSAVITDLDEGETRSYRCTATVQITGGTDTDHVYINATGITATATTTTHEPPPTTHGQDTGNSEIAASSSTSSAADINVPAGVLIAALIALVLLIVLCAGLAIVYCRGRKRNRYRSRDSTDIISMRSGIGVSRISDKDCVSLGGTSMGGFTMVIPPGRHHYSMSRGDAPSCVAPDAPGGNRYVMQYQKPLPLKEGGVPCTEDKGNILGPAGVQYQEPWGRVDDEIVSRVGSLRPNQHMCQIPGFDNSSAAENKLSVIDDNS